ncbi:hypothetical protein F4813DRAFT_211963 [Daldinia decipiens]|uniref:uncharacterized protein n=1 Tax=Daldinia decipiens TaxID=326647 RepID=UPI0020C20909|nr:uncharacterized protein F4813DRAFT_211963 [Daldinia decipiens]KAI1654298.1 hypothetical protein F4813DRAFT_211963 [Daldinia decipiens]
MAEVFGIVIGAVGLASALGACIDGRMLELRLSRWGEALGVDEDPQLSNPLATNDQIRTAKDALIRILELLEESNKLSQKFRPSCDQAGDRSERDEGKEKNEHSLSRKIREVVARRRRHGANPMKTMRWVLYSREHAMQLISDITSLIDLLQHIYPMPDKEQELAREEVRQLTSGITDQGSTIRHLQQLVQGIDNDMKKAIESVERQGHQYGDVSMEENARIQNGHTFTRAWEGASSLPVGPSMTFTCIKASGSSRARNGDVYVEKDDFWS